MHLPQVQSRATFTASQSPGGHLTIDSSKQTPMSYQKKLLALHCKILYIFQQYLTIISAKKVDNSPMIRKTPQNEI